MHTLSSLLTGGSEVGHLWNARLGGDVFCTSVAGAAVLLGVEARVVRSMLCCYCETDGAAVVSLLDVAMVAVSTDLTHLSQRLADTHQALLSISQADSTPTPALTAALRRHRAVAKDAVRICSSWRSNSTPPPSRIDEVASLGSRLRATLAEAAEQLPVNLVAKFPTILPLSLFMFLLGKPKNLGLSPPEACMPIVVEKRKNSRSASRSLSQGQAAVLIQKNYKGSVERRRHRSQSKRLPSSPGNALAGGALEAHQRRTNTTPPRTAGEANALSLSPAPHIPLLEAGSPMPSVSPWGNENDPLLTPPSASLGPPMTPLGLPEDAPIHARNVSPGRPVRRSVDERVSALLEGGDKLRAEIVKGRGGGGWGGGGGGGLRQPMANITNNVVETQQGVQGTPYSAYAGLAVGARSFLREVHTPQQTLPGSPQSGVVAQNTGGAKNDTSFNTSRSPLAPIPPFLQAVQGGGVDLSAGTSPFNRSSSEPMRPVARPPPSHAASMQTSVADQIWQSPAKARSPHRGQAESEVSSWLEESHHAHYRADSRHRPQQPDRRRAGAKLPTFMASSRTNSLTPSSSGTETFGALHSSVYQGQSQSQGQGQQHLQSLLKQSRTPLPDAAQKVGRASWVDTSMRGRARPRVDPNSTLLRDASSGVRMAPSRAKGGDSVGAGSQGGTAMKARLGSLTLASGSDASLDPQSSPSSPTDPPIASRRPSAVR